MTAPGWFLLACAIGAPLALAGSLFAYHLAFQQWYRHKTPGDRYFSLPLQQRQRFLSILKCHASVLVPFYRFMALGVNPKRIPIMRSHGICLPAAIATEATLKAAIEYPATADDIFVATFMKAGTTWMQNIVFELLHHGDGNLGDEGYRHMYALSPWLECSPNASVSLENAPLVSSYRKRIIKTHLPAGLCPYHTSARYIYVLRHPLDTFESCVDFFEMLAGPFCPDRESLAQLFCSENMLWGSWPDHVSGWWQMTMQHSNVLFVRFEDLKEDTPRLLQEIADFLGIEIGEADIQRVASKVSWASMREREASFEMAPPNVFSVTGDKAFLQGRRPATNDKVSDQVMKYCRSGIDAASMPAVIRYFGATPSELRPTLQ